MTACDALGRWIDDGRPTGAAGEHLAHAAGCARCAEALAAADALEAALRAPPPVHAPGFLLAAVMAEVRASPRAAPSVAPARARRRSSPRLLAWTVVGLAVGALGFAAVSWGPPVPAASVPWLPAASLGAPGVPAALTSVSLAAAAALSWLSLKLARAVERSALR